MVCARRRKISVLVRLDLHGLDLAHVWSNTGDVLDGLSSPTNFGDNLSVGKSGES